MKVFAEIIRVYFKMLIQYRWTFAITVVTQPIALFINMSLFKSIYTYNQTNVIKGYSFEQMVWYFLSYMIVNAFVWNATTMFMSNKILSGDLSGDLLKPISVFRLELGSNISSRLIALFMDFIPSMIICSLILFPVFLTPLSFLRFLIVVIPAFFLNYLCAFLLGLLAMPMKDNSSLITLSNLFLAFAGGAFLPLEFFPAAVNRVLAFFPFTYIYYWPIQFLLNKAPADRWDQCITIVIIQLVWIAVLYVICKLSWKLLVKKYCAAGG
ncbi:MAG: ABC-2 family transporter protein [Spirochaetales bacterium]|nr:ABC-2 family transporter protein [Spirochaetales bacterium]